jgi:Sulfotransferase domain
MRRRKAVPRCRMGADQRCGHDACGILATLMQRERASLTKNTIRRLKRRAIERAMVVTEASLQAIGVSSPLALLLLGHMRSGSTLLLHLLMTNPEVSAKGERGATYGSRADLARLALATRMAHRSPFRLLRYVVDQVNHNHLTPNTGLLHDPRVRILFLLRRPESSLASILELYRAHYPEAWSPARAVEYYVERLAALMKLGDGLASPKCAALIRYETLTESPQETLKALRLFLGLRQEFSHTYDTYSFTRTYGDPGPNIAAGRIIRSVPTTQIHLSESELERATKAYLECGAALDRFALRGAL